MKIVAVQNLIDMVNSPDDSDRNVAIALLESGQLEDSYISQLYDYFIVENAKWLYKDIWVEVRKILRAWKQMQSSVD